MVTEVSTSRCNTTLWTHRRRAENCAKGYAFSHLDCNKSPHIYRRREEGSGWGTRVYMWQIHVDIWQNQYNIVKLKNKIKYKKNNIIFFNLTFLKVRSEKGFTVLKSRY